MTNHIGLVYSKTKKELWGPIWLGMVYVENQTRQKLDRLYKYGAKNETKLSLMIRSSVVCDKNQTGQQRDWSYRCGLHQK